MTEQELYQLLEKSIPKLYRVCKKMFTGESLNDRLTYENNIERIIDEKEVKCNCTYSMFKSAIFILDKYMIYSKIEIQSMYKCLETIKFESC